MPKLVFIKFHDLLERIHVVFCDCITSSFGVSFIILEYKFLLLGIFWSQNEKIMVNSMF